LTGSDGIGDYGYITRWSGERVGTYQNVPSYIPTQHANPLLHWQTNYKLEGAIQLGFFKDRISIELAFYRNRCGDQLIQYNLPSLTGFGYVFANFPATVENKGLETTISAKIIDKKDLTWSFNFDVGFNRNKLIAFPNLEQTSYASFYKIGQPLRITQLLHYTGVDPLTGKYTYQDKNKDGQLNIYPEDPANDLFVHDLSVRADGGFGTDLQFKGWQLN